LKGGLRRRKRERMTLAKTAKNAKEEKNRKFGKEEI
jgi:hypothetical protein